MNKLKEKLKKNGGFTLIEMLIVVAIIAILIAVSIPLVNGALEKARDATDQANERAAKAIATLYFMGATDDEIAKDGVTPSKEYTPGKSTTGVDAIYYDAKSGNLTYKKPTAYGQCTCKGTCYNGTTDGTHANKVIQVELDDHGVFTPKWVE